MEKKYCLILTLIQSSLIFVVQVQFLGVGPTTPKGPITSEESTTPGGSITLGETQETQNTRRHRR